MGLQTGRWGPTPARFPTSGQRVAPGSPGPLCAESQEALTPPGLAGRLFWWKEAEPPLLSLFTGAEPAPSVVPVLVPFARAPRCLGKTYQRAGGALAHLGQDPGFSTGGCQDPEDWEEQGEDGKDAIHLRGGDPH